MNFDTHALFSSCRLIMLSGFVACVTGFLLSEGPYQRWLRVMKLGNATSDIKLVLWILLGFLNENG
jgi:hypothetical protein